MTIDWKETRDFNKIKKMKGNKVMCPDPDENGWLPIETAPKDVEVWTKIHDELGERNVYTLKKRIREPGCRPLWWYPDGSMYVYYTPTHWKPVLKEQGQ